MTDIKLKDGPDISLIGAMIGDPARANMLSALMTGKALAAGELAREAGVTIQTASSHLSKLEGSGLLIKHQQGRHRYFSLADEEVAHVLEAMAGLAAKRGHMRTRTGPKDPELRKARICYNHLAGELGVTLYDSLLARRHLLMQGDVPVLTESGNAFVSALGVDIDALTKPRRPVCKPCLDWSVRRYHLAGTLGTALLNRMLDLGWAQRIENSRVIAFSVRGEKEFSRAFEL